MGTLPVFKLEKSPSLEIKSIESDRINRLKLSSRGMRREAKRVIITDQ
jgi:hypothetical protein